MKKYYVYLSLLVVMALSILQSCGEKMDTPTDPNAPGSPTKMVVDFQTNNLGSQGLNEPKPANEGLINQGAIFVFRGNTPTSQLDGKALFDFSSGTISPVNISITQGQRYVYVIANVDPSLFANVTQLGDLYNIKTKLSLASLYVNKGVALPMTGMASVDASKSTAENPAKFTVEMNYLEAKLHMSWSNQYAGLVITGAYIVNAKKFSNYFAPLGSTFTDNITNYTHGLNGTTIFTDGKYYPHSPATTEYLDGLRIKDLKADNGIDNNYFYLFDNNISYMLSPTIVVFEGKFDNKTTYYYPVVINGDFASGSDHSFSVKSGYDYYIMVNIKGPGDDNPYNTVPPAAGNIVVTISSAKWKARIINKRDF